MCALVKSALESRPEVPLKGFLCADIFSRAENEVQKSLVVYYSALRKQRCYPLRDIRLSAIRIFRQGRINPRICLSRIEQRNYIRRWAIVDLIPQSHNHHGAANVIISTPRMRYRPRLCESGILSAMSMFGGRQYNSAGVLPSALLEVASCEIRSHLALRLL